MIKSLALLSVVILAANAAPLADAPVDPQKGAKYSVGLDRPLLVTTRNGSSQRESLIFRGILNDNTMVLSAVRGDGKEGEPLYVPLQKKTALYDSALPFPKLKREYRAKIARFVWFPYMIRTTIYPGLIALVEITSILEE